MKLKSICRAVAITALVLIALIAFPFLMSFLHPDVKLLRENTNEFNTTFYRTIIYASTGSVLLIFFGFFGALKLRRIGNFSSYGKALGILILPITLGNLSIGFIVKLIAGNSAFFAWAASGTFLYKALFIDLLNIWQYGLLFVYLYWLNFKDIPANVLDFGIAQHFSRYQLIKDIYLPGSRNLTMLLIVLGILLIVFDDSKITYLFKVSQGTDSELISNWLSRNYQSSLLVNTSFAENLILRSGNFVFLGIAIITVLMYALYGSFFSFLARFKWYPKSLRISTGLAYTQKTWAILLLVLSVLPLVFILPLLKLTPASFEELKFSLLMVLLAAILSSFLAIIFAIAARLGWPDTLSSFRGRSLYFLGGLFLLMFVPPIIILVCGFKWMAIVGYRNEISIYLCWITGHALLSLPLLGSFIIFNHFRLSNNELNYVGVYRMSFFNILKYSFFKRFKAEYLLLFIVSYATIWNESVLNNLFSDYIPSFSSQLKMMIMGSGADYTQAVGYLLVSLLISVTAVAIWQIILKRGQVNDPLYEKD